jgi:hypothetical protein
MPLERYIESAPELAQKALKCWNDLSSNEPGAPTLLARFPVLADFPGLVDRARRFEAATKQAENKEAPTTSSEKYEREAKQARLAFAQEYKRLDDLTGSADELLTSKLELPTEDFGK